MTHPAQDPLWDTPDWSDLVDPDPAIEEWGPEEDWDDEEWIEAPPRRTTVDILRPDLFGPVPEGWPVRVRRTTDATY